MPVIRLKKLIRSFQYALKGFWYVFRHEQSFRLHLLAGLIVIILMISFRVRLWQAIILVLVITIVLILELINTIFEKIVDILEPRIHEYAEMVKDIMAATVLIASISALIIGILIFGPYVIALMRGPGSL